MSENLMQNFNKLCAWEKQKAIFLLSQAVKLEMDISGYGILDVNNTSGNVYLWLEDYPFCLFMPISCKLVKSDIRANWSNPINGEEKDISIKGKNLNALIEWAEKLESGVNHD